MILSKTVQILSMWFFTRGQLGICMVPLSTRVPVVIVGLMELACMGMNMWMIRRIKKVNREIKVKKVITEKTFLSDFSDWSYRFRNSFFINHQIQWGKLPCFWNPQGSIPKFEEGRGLFFRKFRRFVLRFSGFIFGVFGKIQLPIFWRFRWWISIRWPFRWSYRWWSYRSREC